MPRIKNLTKVYLFVLTLALVAAADYGLAFRIYPAVLELPVGAGLFLQAHDTSGSIDHADLEWRSANDRIATVSPGGYVTAISVGDTTAEAFLTSDSSQRAICRIVVTEAGPILLYPNDQSPELSEIPPDTPPQPPSETEDDKEIPVEHDPELDTPVEHDPRIDEFVWTIRIHDTVTKDLDGDLPLKLVCKLDLEAVKVGGKTSRGAYVGTATLEMKVDTGKYVENIMSKAEGVLLKFMVDIGGTYQADLSMEVEAYNMDRFSSFNLKPGEAPVVPLVPLYGMALGQMQFVGVGAAGGSSLDVTGVGVNLYQPSVSSDAPLSYKLSLLGVGKIQMSFDLGLTRSFQGQISRKPFIPN